MIPDFRVHEMLALLVSDAFFLSIHTLDPGKTGVGEVVNSAYIRLPASWAPPANRAVEVSDVPKVFEVDESGGGMEIVAWGAWDAIEDGNFICGAMLDSPQLISTVVGVGGTFTLTYARQIIGNCR